MIQYTPLGNAANGSARVLTATIQDASGVPGSGAGLPSLYWKINSGTWNSVQAVFVSGNTYTFTFGAGSIYNDVVSYYVVAQDMASSPNVGSFPAPGASGFTLNPPACSTPPTTPHTYINLGAITGTYHVGVGKTYATITAAVNDLNFKTRTGPVTFLLDDATYPSETFPITITSSAGASAANYVIIKPNTGNNVLISGANSHSVGSEAEGIFLLKGAQYVTIDGSNSSALSFTENQSMIIENTDYSGASSVFAIASNVSAATSHIKVQNCIIQGVTSVVWATYAVSMYSSLGVIDDITIDNNNIRQGKFGIAIYGSVSVPATNINITNNVIGSSEDSKAITWRGLDAQYCNNILVQGNEIMGMPSGNELFSMCGISLAYCSNSNISKNVVHDWILNDLTNFSYGIAFHDASSSHGEITNNLVYNISAWGSNISPTQGSAHGIQIDRTNNLLMAYNTVKLSGAVLTDGDNSGINPGTTSTCVFFTTQASGVDFRNNILNNSMTRNPSATSLYTTTYAVACAGINNPFTYCDNNDYFGDGFNPYVGYAAVTDLQSLNDWKTWTAKDWSSIYSDPLLTSTTNLLPQNSSPVIGVGVPLTAVTDDILGISRSTHASTLGAYELPVYAVTFNVDMSTVAGFTHGSDLVYLAGNFPGVSSWNQPGTNPNLLLSQVGTTMIYSITLYLPARTYEYKYFMNAGWGGGEYTGGPNRSATITTATTINDVWGGSINWANLQWPGAGSINLGDSYDVYAQVYIPNGITAATGATYGLQAWIGYSNSNTDPSTWTNWVPAPFFGQSSDNDEFKLDLGSAITTPGTYYYASRFQFGNGPLVYGGFNGGFWNGTSNNSGVLDVIQTTKSLSINALLESLYADAGVMNKAQNETGDQFPGTTADQITIELHNAANYADILFTASNIDLSISGDASLTLPSSFNGSYYITIKHRNSIETVSALPVSFAGSTISYSFNSVTQAFGSNMTVMGGYSLIYSSDVNQDGLVDSSDLNQIDNDVSNFTTGYIASDVNGDGLVDSTDLNMIDNNSSAFISTITP
ncbi:MAG: hypothetical protein IPH88_08670 [Bacteroidales bacterium]|nr:hypothetical protein [Bacteroidales bacterium]